MKTTTPAGKIQFAVALRGLAAISVLIGHYFMEFWGDSNAVSGLILSTPAKVTFPPYLVFLRSITLVDWGALGVAVFFIVSGFVIQFSLQSGSALSFLVGRFFRIYPLYWCGFAITLLSLWISSRYFAVAWPYSIGQVAMHFAPGLRDLVWSANMDGIIWTLEIEVKFYVLCALAMPLFRRRSQAVFLFPVALTFLSFIAWHCVPFLKNSPVPYFTALTIAHVSPYLTFMFVGVAFHYMFVGRIEAPKAVLMISGVFLLFAVQIAFGMYAGATHMLWSYGIALVIFATACAYHDLFSKNALFEFLADISYPLYVVHAVAGYVALRLLVELSVPSFIALPMVIAAALYLAWILHLFVEKPAHDFGKVVAARFRQSKGLLVPA